MHAELVFADTSSRCRDASLCSGFTSPHHAHEQNMWRKNSKTGAVAAAKQLAESRTNRSSVGGTEWKTMESRQEDEAKGMPGKVALFFSALTHVLLVAPVIYIVALYLVDYRLFSWHPVCMAVGVGLLMTEAVFGISGEAYLTSKLKRVDRVTFHWTLNAVGLGLLMIGLIIIVVIKNQHGREHFTTTHGKLGISSIVIALAVGAFGTLTNNTRWLYPRVRPVLLKVGHAFGGISITILLLATLINGTYTHSFPGSDTGRSLTFASLFIAGVFVIVKPLLGAISRSRVLFERSRAAAVASENS